MVDRTVSDAHPGAHPEADGDAGGEVRPDASPDVRPGARATGAAASAASAADATDAPATDARMPAEPKQRWRLVVARGPGAPSLAQRDVAEAWQAALVASGLPIARTEGARARLRVSFGAPLAASMPAEGELIDVVLTERWPRWRVREGLESCVPGGWRLVDAHEVWLAGPPLAGRVAGADYRVTVRAAQVPTADVHARLGAACAALLAAPRIPRDRAKGNATVRYDLRPLLLDIVVRHPPSSAVDPIVVVARTRSHPELGSGRPEEVVAALAETAGIPLTVESVVRERLVLIEDLTDPVAKLTVVAS